MKINYRQAIARVVAIALVITAVGFQSSNALAASITSFSDNMSRLKISTLSNHDIRFVTPTGVDANTDTITITFAGGFTMGTFSVTNVDLNVSATGACTTFGTSKTLAASPASGVWGVAQSGQVITFTAPTGATTGEIAAGKCVQILIGSGASGGADQITNPSSAAGYSISIGGTFGDTGTSSVAIITNDQVTVDATVDPSLTFSISANTIHFGTLTAANARFADTSTGSTSSTTVAHTLAAGTNATSGYVIYVLGDTLKSGANSITAIGGSATASSPGSSQFGLTLNNVAPSGGSGTATAPYSTNGSYGYAATTTTQSQVASATGATASTTYSATYIANIPANQQAGTYNTTLTYTATATY